MPNILMLAPTAKSFLSRNMHENPTFRSLNSLTCQYRLLDWTHNPLVALYFACRENSDREASVFCYDPEQYVDVDVVPLEENDVPSFGYIPRWTNQRLVTQRSAFTVHLPTTKSLSVSQHPAFQKKHPNLAILHIPADFKSDLLRTLDDYGINETMLFPDLGGLSRHINWETREIAAKSRN